MSFGRSILALHRKEDGYKPTRVSYLNPATTLSYRDVAQHQLRSASSLSASFAVWVLGAQKAAAFF